MAIDGEKPLQDDIPISICLTDAEIKNWGLTYETDSPYECFRDRAASDVERPRAQETCRNSCTPDFSTVLDLECGLVDAKEFVEKSEKACRICSFGFDTFSPELAYPIVLGCSCKGDLAFAHQKCAETWFEIRGNMNCEICGSKVKNLIGFEVVELMENRIEPCNNTATATPTQRFCQGHRLLSCVLGGMLVAIFICWLH